MGGVPELLQPCLNTYGYGTEFNSFLYLGVLVHTLLLV